MAADSAGDGWDGGGTYTVSGAVQSTIGPSTVSGSGRSETVVVVASAGASYPTSYPTSQTNNNYGNDYPTSYPTYQTNNNNNYGNDPSYYESSDGSSSSELLNDLILYVAGSVPNPGGTLWEGTGFVSSKL